jgi:hypothetical protein
MNENNKSTYSLDMFEFIHHPKCGCRDLKGLMKIMLLFKLQKHGFSNPLKLKFHLLKISNKNTFAS